MVKAVIKKNNKRLEELKDFVKNIQDKLTETEAQRMYLELRLIEEEIDEVEHDEVLVKLVQLLEKKRIEPIEKEVNSALNRAYEIAGFGCKTSCISSSNIVLETEKLLKEKSASTYEFISVKGHMAPLFMRMLM